MVEAVNKAFKTASLTAEDVARGKALVKAAILRADDNSGQYSLPGDRGAVISWVPTRPDWSLC